MQRVLTFNWNIDSTLDRDIDKMIKLFQKNNIGFIFYRSNGCYHHQFVVLKSDKKWNNIMALVNSVKPAKYTFKNSEIRAENGRYIELVNC